MNIQQSFKYQLLYNHHGQSSSCQWADWRLCNSTKNNLTRVDKESCYFVAWKAVLTANGSQRKAKVLSEAVGIFTQRSLTKTPLKSELHAFSERTLHALRLGHQTWCWPMGRPFALGWACLKGEFNQRLPLLIKAEKHSALVCELTENDHLSSSLSSEHFIDERPSISFFSFILL